VAMLSLPPLPLYAGDRVCVAVSGGGDSVALLRLMHAANTQSRGPLGIGLAAIHVNHGLRGQDSDGDQAFIECLCGDLAVPLTVRRVETRARVDQQGETVEEAARALRYEVFQQALSDGSANVIMTAHTLDDQAETVLMKLLRGAWLEGLSAIAPVLDVPGGRILRPLLAIRRENLRDYLRECRQEWREDSSNDDETFTRNRLRKSVLPVLRAENPAIDQTLVNLAELAREEEVRWVGELKRILPQVLLPGVPVRGGGRSNSTAPGSGAVAVELERLRALDPATRRRVVRAAARQLGLRIGFDETTRLLTLAGLSPQLMPDPTVPVKAGSSLRLRGGLVAERSVRELRFRVEAPTSE
jgi:tRNA(Ile)-lysidine synthase